MTFNRPLPDPCRPAPRDRRTTYYQKNPNPYACIGRTFLRFGKKIEISQTGEERYSKEITSASNRLSLALDVAYKREGDVDELKNVSAVLDNAIAKERAHSCIDRLCQSRNSRLRDALILFITNSSAARRPSTISRAVHSPE